MYLGSVEMKETGFFHLQLLVVFSKTSFLTKGTSTLLRVLYLLTEGTNHAQRRDLLWIAVPSHYRAKNTMIKIPGKEFLQSVRNLQFGIPQGRTEFLFQSFHKLFELLCTNLQKEETEMSNLNFLEWE